MINRNETVDYVCRIVDGGDSPRFEIDPADQPGMVISSGTPTGAWTQIVKAANLIRQRNHSNSVSGPEYYGLAALPIKALIQELPGARTAPTYVWQHFAEEVDSITPALGGRPGVVAGASKVNRVVGKKRKAPKAEDEEDDIYHAGGMHGAHASPYSDTAYSRSPSAMQGSLSPQQQHYSPYHAAPSPVSSLSNLVNPYDLPPPLPMATGPVPYPFDPYAISPPPISAYRSPAIGSPIATWGATPVPWFDEQSATQSPILHSPYGAPMNRTPTNGSMNGSI